VPIALISVTGIRRKFKPTADYSKLAQKTVPALFSTAGAVFLIAFLLSLNRAFKREFGIPLPAGEISRWRRKA
jgi:hypothetical protein